MIKLRLEFLIPLILMLLVGCQTEPVESKSTADVLTTGAQTSVNDKIENEINAPGIYVIVHIKDQGPITVKMRPDVAPLSVENYTSLAKNGFYDGLIFHRVIKDFMIQGGDPKGDGSGGSDEQIKGEFSSNGIENTLSHKRGVISMARSNDPNSASSQFFIVHQDAEFLDGDYAAFGEVVSGMEIVDAIATTETNAFDKPLQDQVIESTEVIILD